MFCIAFYIKTGQVSQRVQDVWILLFTLPSWCHPLVRLRLSSSQMWDTESGQKLQDTEAHQGAILACHVSPDGRLFTTTSADRTAKVTHGHTHTLVWDDTHLF